MIPSRTALAALLFAAASCRPDFEPGPPALELSFLASTLLPVGAALEQLPVGGISALSYSPSRGTWIALSDDRVSSRFFELAVELDGGSLSTTPRSVVLLKNAGGSAFPEDVLDPEGLTPTPWGNLFISTEPDARDEPVEQAKLLEFDTSGGLLREYDLPEKFRLTSEPHDRGLRPNRGFESLSLSPDGTSLFLGAEATLVQDGEVAGREGAGFSRILVHRIEGRELLPAAEYVYPLGPFALEPDFEEQEIDGGLVELCALSSERLLALERIFIRELSGAGRDVTRARIYDVDLASATDVSGVASLAESTDWRPVTKELVFDLEDVASELDPEYPRLDNLEAMSIGTDLPGGGKALLLASDDNFQEHQRTQFLLLRLLGFHP